MQEINPTPGVAQQYVCHRVVLDPIRKAPQATTSTSMLQRRAERNTNSVRDDWDEEEDEADAAEEPQRLWDEA